MADLDTIMNDLELCTHPTPSACRKCTHKGTPDDCPFCFMRLAEDTLELLKEKQKYIATLHSLMEKQRQQIEVLEHWKPEWIPTRTNMPKEGQIVLVVTPEYTDGEGDEYTEGVQCGYWLFPQDPTWFSSDGVTYGNGGRIVNPTHWIELPIPPKDGDQ